ncbi:MAG: hypothetical protein QW096_11175 [Thermofilaceae archaeon]
MIICLDGIDGAGKTTQVKYLQIYFLRKGYNVKVLKPFNYSRYVLKKFDNIIRMVSNTIKRTEAYDSSRDSHLNLRPRYFLSISLIKDFIKLIVVLINFTFEILFTEIIYGKRIIIIYDRFYFDKLIPKNKFEYRLYYLVLKQFFKGRYIKCIILDIPTMKAYTRMRDVHDKLIPKKYYNYLRKWYRIYAMLLNFPIIDTSKTSHIEAHTLITSFIENRISKTGR